MSSSPRADALVVVDVQERWAGSRHELVGILRAGVERARAAGALIVHLHDDIGGVLALRPLAGEPVMGKPGDDGFQGTELESRLRETGCKTLAVTGLLAEMCVAATARGALDRGWAVIWPRDAITTDDVPAAGSAPAVPAAQVSRVAEWSLGDELVAVDRLADVTFGPPQSLDTSR